MIADERRAAADPGGHTGATLQSSAAGSTPTASEHPPLHVALRLPRRTPHRLPQPCPRRAPRAQACGVAGGHRDRAGQDQCRGHRRAPGGRRRDRHPLRQNHRPLQDGQTLHRAHRREGVHRHPQPHRHRRRSRPRRHLRDPHLRARHRAAHRPGRGDIQVEPGSNATSAASKPSTFRCARSTTTPRPESVPTCSCACSPPTSSGTCAKPGRR